MPSKVNKHVERMTKLKERIRELGKRRDFMPEFRLPCTPTSQSERTYQVAYVRDDGDLELRQLVLRADSARLLAFWILEWYAGHEEPAQESA